MNKPLIVCENLVKTYRDGNMETEVLRGVSFGLEQGELVAVVGSSGSGKSTLLHLLGGLDKPTDGRVLFQGQDVYAMSNSAQAKLRNEHIGFVYQFHHLLADFTALENVAMPLLIAGEKPSVASQRAQEMLTAVGLARRIHHRPSEVSGGERQRIAIARALVNQPSLVLADEPTGNLDQRTADGIFELLGELNARHGTAFLVVTHDLNLAARLSRQLEMRDGLLTRELSLSAGGR